MSVWWMQRYTGHAPRERIEKAIFRDEDATVVKEDATRLLDAIFERRGCVCTTSSAEQTEPECMNTYQ